MIEEDILIQYGAVIRAYKKGSLLFQEGGIPKFYFQLVSGEIKMFNIGDDGKEFIQGVFKAGESFGEPLLFIDEKYPASAGAITDCEILIMERAKFLHLLQEHFSIQLHLLKTLSSRLYFKSIMGKEIAIHDAAHRILSLIDFLKIRDGKNNEKYLVGLTRQQLANLTGLRVETVIRTVKHLIGEKQLTQLGRKVYR